MNNIVVNTFVEVVFLVTTIVTTTTLKTYYNYDCYTLCNQFSSSTLEVMFANDFADTARHS